MTPESTPAVWLRWVLPSFADVFFLVLLGMLRIQPDERRFAPRCGYWLAHPERRTDPGDPRDATHRPLFLHQARRALVRMGVDVRHGHCGNPPRLWFEWSRTFYRSSHQRHLRTPVSIHFAPKRKPGGGGVSDPIGGSSCPGSHAREATRPELAANAALGGKHYTALKMASARRCSGYHR